MHHCKKQAHLTPCHNNRPAVVKKTSTGCGIFVKISAAGGLFNASSRPYPYAFERLSMCS